MKGFWLATQDDKTKELAWLKDPRVSKVLYALKSKGKEGLSNAELDSLLGTSSQWLIFWEMRELVALDIVKYEVQLFGESGKYLLTEKGASLVQTNGS